MIPVKNAEIGEGRNFIELWLFGWVIMGNVTGTCENVVQYSLRACSYLQGLYFYKIKRLYNLLILYCASKYCSLKHISWSFRNYLISNRAQWVDVWLSMNFYNDIGIVLLPLRLFKFLPIICEIDFVYQLLFSCILTTII